MDRLSPVAANVFSHFLSNADRAALQTIDWERFFIFVVVCHETATECGHENLHRALVDAGFRDERASALVEAYFLGRELLKSASCVAGARRRHA